MDDGFFSFNNDGVKGKRPPSSWGVSLNHSLTFSFRILNLESAKSAGHTNASPRVASGVNINDLCMSFTCPKYVSTVLNLFTFGASITKYMTNLHTSLMFSWFSFTTMRMGLPLLLRNWDQWFPPDDDFVASDLSDTKS